MRWMLCSHAPRRAFLAALALLTLAALGPAPASVLAAPMSVASTTASIPALAHVVVVVEENEASPAILGNVAQAPYLNGTLIPAGALATDYLAITHPSLPNYFALTYGTTFGLTSDLQPSQFKTSHASIATTLLAHGLTWKAYAESMPGPCAKADAGKYLAHHNPFVYSTALPSCATDDVPYTQFAHDLAATTTTPAFAFIVPNACDDGHNGTGACGGISKVNNADRWLAAQVPAILASPAFTTQASLLVITWDEGSKTNNRVLTLFVGSPGVVTAGIRDTTLYGKGHYSLLHTIEQGLGLPTLTTHDASAPVMVGMCAV